MNEVRPVAVYTDADDTDITEGIRMLEAAGFEVRFLDTRDPEAIRKGAHDADVLLPGYASLDAELIESLPRLKLISLMSMGFDYVDIDAAAARGVWVSNVPGAATEEVATHTLALILHLTRQLPFYLGSANSHDWNARCSPPPPRLSECRLGLIGLGRIGREVARLAAPLFDGVLGFDPLLPDNAESRTALARIGVRRTDLETVRRESDVLSLHLPLTAESRHLVDAEFLRGMRLGSWLVNVSRGALVNESDLIEALDSGRLRGAALDVLEHEPPTATDPILGRRDVVITPHIAYYSDRTESEYLRIQARNAIAVVETGSPISQVNMPTGDSAGEGSGR